MLRDERGVSDAIGEIVLVAATIALTAILMANVVPLFTSHSSQCQIQVSASKTGNVTILCTAGHVSLEDAAMLITTPNGTVYATLHYDGSKFVGKTATGTTITSLNKVPEELYPCDYVIVRLPPGLYKITIATKSEVISQVPIFVP